jgi:Flp pilus assembly pilin Flp
MAGKLKVFLSDDSASAAVEFCLIVSGVALMLIAAIKPVSVLPSCPGCGMPMRFKTTIGKFGFHPELRTYECRRCEMTELREDREEPLMQPVLLRLLAPSDFHFPQ